MGSKLITIFFVPFILVLKTPSNTLRQNEISKLAFKYF